MKKFFSVLTIMSLMSLCASAVDVDLTKKDPSVDPLPSEGRSETVIVTASIDGQVLTVQFSELTSSQIMERLI